MKKLKTAAAITSIIAIVAVVAALASINPRNSAQAQADSGICGRDAAVQTAIIASIADVSLCTDVTDAHLTAISGTLDLSGGTLTTLATSDLQGLSGITDLDLSNNDIDDLPSHVFDALTALQEIDLSGNGMSMLPPYPFHHNLNLQVIDGSDNDIPLLHEGIFSNNAALLEVNFSDNEITYLSGTEFKSSPLLTKIDLANNTLPGLAVGMFNGLENLAELYLAGNTGAPFTVDMQPLGLGANAFTVATGGGAPPFNATATVTATGGTLSHSTVSFLAGRDLTEVITVTHLGAEPATITVSGAAFTAGTYTGITASNGTTLSIPQNGATTGICSRTREIQNAIITLLGSASCATVTNTQLASITKPLAVAGTSMSTLREGDLDGLTGVRDLYLYGNEITELPDELFKDAGSFDRVLIQDNPGGPFKLEVTLTEKSQGTYVAQIREGSPFHVEVTLKATGATLYPRVTDIYGGDTESNEITATADGSGDTLLVEIDQVKFRDWGITNYSYYDGFELTIGTSTDATTTSETATPVATATPVPTVEPPAATPLTASSHNAPASHDGTTAFTFELRLSEEPKPSFSYTTMHEHAFTVTAGSITRARRLNPPSNSGWEITVQPSGNADVTVSLPATTDCNAQGAICTSDGRTLSNRLEMTISGPSE